MKSLNTRFFIQLSLAFSFFVTIFFSSCSSASSIKTEQLFNLAVYTDFQRDTSTENFDFEIFLFEGSKTEPIQLTDNKDDDILPDISPDGRKIIFESDREGNAEIYIMNIDGTNQMNLTNHSAWDGEPKWSADGSKIAFTSNRDGNMNIYIMEADGGYPTPATDSPRDEVLASWSPDNSKLVFLARENHEPHDIYVLNFIDGTIEQLTNTQNHDEFAPLWSPDGTKILFFVADPPDDADEEIYVINPDGTNRKNLTNHGSDDLYPIWSPDGNYILFGSSRGDTVFDRINSNPSKVFVMRADGSQPVETDYEAKWLSDVCCLHP